jgi:uncharacterized membrane protein YkoI
LDFKDRSFASTKVGDSKEIENKLNALSWNSSNISSTIKSEELEREQGRLIWSFDNATNGTKDIIVVQVGAKDGKVVSVQTESPRDQAKEVAGEESKSSR